MTRPTTAAAPAPAEAPVPDPAGELGPVPWRPLVRLVLIGTLLLLALVLVDVHRNGGDNPVSLIQPGTEGPATDLFTQDFPDLEQPPDKGLDGQMYYAIARDPFHLDETGAYLDHPQYRLQRPLLPWLSWALHPTGGGLGLVAAMVFVTLAGIALGALAVGLLSWRWGGPLWLAALFPVLPGAYWSLRVTVSDALALGLALLAIHLASRNRIVAAAAIGALAVLAKEPVVLVLGGWWLAHRTRRQLPVVVVPGLVAAAWMGWLHTVLPGDLERSQDITLPFVGLWEAWFEIWSHGRELVAMACTLTGLAIGVTALVVRRLRHPLGWALLVQLGFVLCMGMNPNGTNFGGTRMSLPLMVLGGLALLTPAAARRIEGEAAAPVDADAPVVAVALPSAPAPAAVSAPS